MAENIETATPTINVKAKPLTTLVPNQKSMKAVINVEMLPSLIDDQALENPSSRARPKLFAAARSSLILSNTKILASTAIPIERMKPAMPESVKVTGISLKIARTITA